MPPSNAICWSTLNALKGFFLNSIHGCQPFNVSAKETLLRQLPRKDCSTHTGSSLTQSSGFEPYLQSLFVYFSAPNQPHKIRIKTILTSYITKRHENWQSNKHMCTHVHTVLSAVAKAAKELTGTSTDEQINQMRSIHPMEQYRA